MTKPNATMQALLLWASAGCVALPSSPLAIGRMSPSQITSVTPKNLCYAFDRGQADKPVVRAEVARRRLDCAQILLQAGLEPQGAARGGLQNVAPSGDCGGIEFLGLFGTAPVVGIRTQFAKIRNKGTFAKIVEVNFFEEGIQKSARGEVSAGGIESIKLTTSDRVVSSVRLVSCR